MQIIIPMSGFGERFRRAGYRTPKALIEVEDRPMIAHIVDMFPGEKRFLFICNEEHLRNTSYCMEKTIRLACPQAEILRIPPHRKGPIHAVLQGQHLIDPDAPVIINYCDFTCYWDWARFKNLVKKNKCAGALPAYRGFHPHSLGTTNYAYIRGEEEWAQDIQEKKPFTSNRMEEFASSGTYYFSSGALALKAFEATVEKDLNTGGEYYVSLAYKYLFSKKLPVLIYPLEHFMQWGTPEDLEEYCYWSRAFRKLIDGGRPLPSSEGSFVIPMAGLGKRFTDAGYTTVKPLIPVSGRPMVLQAAQDLPKAQAHAFVLRGDMADSEGISRKIRKDFPHALIEILPKVSEGQALSALAGIEALEREELRNIGPLTVGACDSGVIYDEKKWQRLCHDPNVDIIVWGIRGYPAVHRHPASFGWIEEKEGIISRIRVKEVPRHPGENPIVIGIFTFCRPRDYNRCVKNLIKRDGRVNGEFYIDSCINDATALGLRCHLFEVDYLFSWGTPNDLKTFQYWQSCFHKWDTHPYRFELDKRVSQ